MRWANHYAHYAHGEDGGMRTLAIGLLAIGILLGCLSVVYPAGNYAPVLTDSEHASIAKDVAVMDAKLQSVVVRVSDIESRLFAIFLAAGGALCGSVATTIISLLTHRNVRSKG